MAEKPNCEPLQAASAPSGMARRSAIGGMLAGILAATGLEVASAKKGGNGKGRGRGKGKGKGRGKGKGKQKVQICHRTGQGFNLIEVSQSAIPAHQGHGDTVCTPGPCQTGVTGCASTGACEFALAAPGSPCTVNSAPGLCSAEGVCTPS